jgi:hypothetical protein
MSKLTLDLNDLAVESFGTDLGEPELLARPPRVTEDIILCAAGETFACIAGSPTNEVILC